MENIKELEEVLLDRLNSRKEEILESKGLLKEVIEDCIPMKNVDLLKVGLSHETLLTTIPGDVDNNIPRNCVNILARAIYEHLERVAKDWLMDFDELTTEKNAN